MIAWCFCQMVFRKTRSVSVVVPAFNEQDRIAGTLKRLRTIKDVSEIVVVDDGSWDKTSEIAKRYANVVVRNQENKGKGFSIRVGAQRARGEWLVFIDASQFNPEDISRLLAAARPGVEMVVGSRDFTRIPWKRRITNKLTILAILMGTGKRISDPLTGFRLIRTGVFNALGTREDRFNIEAEVNFRFLRKRLALREVPVRVDYLPHEAKHARHRYHVRGSRMHYLKERFLREAVFNFVMVLRCWAGTVNPFHKEF